MCICLQMSLWESSFVTKQSHLDGSGKRHSHMLSHRVRVPGICWTCKPYVCLWFPWVSLLSIHTQTHRLLRCTCVHTLITQCYICTPPCTSFTFKCLIGELSGGLVSGFSRFPARQKPMAKANFPSWKEAVCLEPRNLLFYVQDYEGKNGKRPSKKCRQRIKH